MYFKNLILLFLITWPVLVRGNSNQASPRELESNAKIMVKDAKSLEKSGHLVEARKEYAQSQALFETKESQKGIKRVDDKLHNEVKGALAQAQSLYDSGQFQEAAGQLQRALLLETSTARLERDLALCQYKLGDSTHAIESLAQAIAGTSDPKKRQKLLLLRTTFMTGEAVPSFAKSERQRVAQFNEAIPQLGFGANLDDSGGQPQIAKADDRTAAITASMAGMRPCLILKSLEDDLAGSASAVFDTANCAETNARPGEAAQGLLRYLKLAPKALDGDEVHTRLVELHALMSLSSPNGDQVRKLCGSASREIEERKYNRGLADLLKSDSLAPDFALTKWKLALFYEATGNIAEARTYFTRYQQVSAGDDDGHPANLHLNTLAARRAKYDEEVSAARDILADLLRRSLNLGFDQPTGRPVRAHATKTHNRKKATKEVGGFAVPFGYAQQQLAMAGNHLQLALSLFPLGAEANELMAFVYLQANDGQSAIRCFDAVASQNLPVAFYAECRGHRLDHAARCELSAKRIRLIFLSSYDKKGRPTPPEFPAGKDGLGDLVVAPSAPRQAQFDALVLNRGDIEQVETKNGLVRVKLAKQELTLSPIFTAADTPVEGPPARRFANTYTRLFVRYPGLEDSKLGKEGLTGMEKVKLGTSIAKTGADIAMTAIMPMAALAAFQDTQNVISVALRVNKAMSSLKVGFGGWERIISEEQRMLAGDPFKAIPTQPVDLSFDSQAD